VLDLQALALRFGQVRVVSDFGNDARNPRTEYSHQLLVRGVGILNRVVEQRRAQHLHVCHAALVDQHVGERNRMVYVRRGGGVLAPLVAMLVRSEGERLKKER
jgi:hypothetical protein